MIALQVKWYPRGDRVVLGTICVVSTAIALHLLKKKAQMLYAVLEMLSATALAACTFDGLPDVVEPVRLLGVVTSIYFFARGFDSFRRARVVCDPNTPADSFVAIT
jgi:hypothetical protein